MLNMIISILGDSFDEFQYKAEIYDSREMTEAVIEVEQIKSLISPISVEQYFNICINPLHNLENVCGGRIADLHLQVEKSCKKT